MVIHKSTVPGGFLPPVTVFTIIYVKKYLVLSETYPDIPKTYYLYMASMDQYMSSWKSVKLAGILTCG